MTAPTNHHNQHTGVIPVYSDLVGSITGENTFTLSAANVLMPLKDIKKTIRHAIYTANNKERIETYSIWFGDKHTKDRASRSWHVAILRSLSAEEKYWIENLFRDVCRKERWGCPRRFFRWNVNLKDKEGQHSLTYLFDHVQAVPVKVSPGRRTE